MARRSLWRFLCIITLLCGALLPGWQTASAQSSAWSRVQDIPGTFDFQDIFMFDQTRAWGVGNNGAGAAVFQLSLQNGRWVVALDTDLAPGLLLALSVVSPTNIWAVGEDGLIVHKDSNGWQTIASPVPGATLNAIQMLGSGTEGWAAGRLPASNEYTSETVLLHYQNGQWQRDTSIPNAGAIHALHFANDGGWAVGDAIWRYSGGSWSLETPPQACGDTGCAWTLTGVRAINAEEAWAVGARIGICTVCSQRYYAIHRTNGQWNVVLSGTGVINEPPRDVPAVVHQEWTSLEAVSFTADGQGVAVGGRGAPPADPTSRQFIVRYRDGYWVYDPTPAVDGVLKSISMADAAHGLAAGSGGLILSTGYGPQSPSTPAGFAPISDPKLPGVIYFDVVGHTLSAEFKNYWERNGGLPVFGYPLSEQIYESNADLEAEFVTQYFERERFEAHPENVAPYNVLLGRLGAELLARQNRNWRDEDTASATVPGSACETFVVDTERREVCGLFLRYWQTHGLEFDGQAGTSQAESLALIGLPLTSPKVETNPDGQLVVTQWFERARLEYHPGNPTEYLVLLGRLGSELLKARGIQVP